MIDVMVVLGTRPELLKLLPVVRACRARGLSVRVALTGQHAELLDVPAVRGLGECATLKVPNDGNVLRFTHAAKRAVLAEIATCAPRCVVVQGDTASAHAGALAAAHVGIPVAHVEAGLRSGSLEDPWPEEGIRRAISALALWHYAPTTTAAMRLNAELLDAKRYNCEILVTGNTSVDAVTALGVLSRPEDGAAVLVTLHRRELRERSDLRDVLRALVGAVAATPEVRALWPVHPAMQAEVDAVRGEGAWPANFGVAHPLPHAMTLRILAGARGVLTDSGGLTEEAATLGVPTAVLRFHTDRPEAEEVGIAARFDPTPEGVAAAWKMLSEAEVLRTPSDVFGDGHAAEYIARHLAKVLK